MPDEISHKIRESPEIAAIVQRWYRAFTSGDTDTVDNLFSESGALSYVGSAEGEIYGHDALKKGFASYVAEIPRFTVSEEKVKAFECGASGWSFWSALVRVVGDEQCVRFRSSMVFTLEKGAWKIVQVHHSNPVSSMQALGFEHTALDALCHAAMDADPPVDQTGIASVMFTDIANSSAIAEAVGDARWADTVQRHLTGVTGVITAHDGTLVKSLGDGTMSSFHSASAAMRAAQAAQTRLGKATEEPRLQMRIGIHTGDVVHAGGDFFGSVVNKAARITTRAAPGEIRVSDATRVMIGGADGFAFSDPARVALKGLEGEHLIYRLEW
jgi:class 3 adenylate cyclase